MDRQADGTRRIPVVAGSLAGLVAWALGYAFTYVLVAPEVRDSPLQRLVEAFGGAPATHEMVAWVFFNAHFVDTVFRNVPVLGGRTTSFVGGEGGFSVLLYLVPVGLLLAAGLALARYDGSSTPTRGAIVGLTALPGYLVASVAGAMLAEVTVAEVSGGPDPLQALVLAGTIYPVVVAGGAGAVVGMVADS